MPSTEKKNCPSCGAVEVSMAGNPFRVSETHRICYECGQEWFTDVDYTRPAPKEGEPLPTKLCVCGYGFAHHSKLDGGCPTHDEEGRICGSSRDKSFRKRESGEPLPSEPAEFQNMPKLRVLISRAASAKTSTEYYALEDVAIIEANKYVSAARRQGEAAGYERGISDHDETCAEVGRVRAEALREAADKVKDMHEAAQRLVLDWSPYECISEEHDKRGCITCSKEENEDHQDACDWQALRSLVMTFHLATTPKETPELDELSDLSQEAGLYAPETDTKETEE